MGYLAILDYLCSADDIVYLRKIMGYLAILDYLCSADDIVYLRKKL